MSDIHDVIQVGYGPVSQALALMLGRQGRTVAIAERWHSRYPLPRAVCVDHELFRVLALNGMRDILPTVSHPAPLYQWFNAEWRKLLEIDWTAEAISGGPEVHFVHQPTLEEAMDAEVRALAGVTLYLGQEAVRIDQFADHAAVTIRDVASGEERMLRGRYVIGCDGANSIVRAAIGGDREDRGFDADWLVIDVLLKPGVTIESLGIPGAGQYCNPERPTTIVPAGVREGRIFRRWEFMRLPGETAQELEREERVWELLAPWAGPADIELVRHKIYNFGSLLAGRWRDRRLLIAGDAAHVMPPFMGQGMCAGLRDGWNLAWKLGMILDGLSGDTLLETYQAERMPHVSQIIDASIYLGKIICMPDAAQAAERDRAFLEGDAPPPVPFPHLTAGILHRGDPLAGLLSPHVHVRAKGARVRLDDLVGPGFLVIAQSFDPREALSSGARAFLDGIGARYVHLSGDGPGGAIDLDGRIAPFLKQHGRDAMIVRPDFYVYGSASDAAALAALAEDLRADLIGAGVDVEVAASALVEAAVS